MDLGISGRTAVVLGGTAGLGWASAQALAAEGAHVVIVGREQGRCDEQAAKLDSAIGFAADITDPDAPKAIIEAAVDAFGAVDILVLNGGGPPPGGAAGLDADKVEQAIGLLVAPQVELATQCVPAMAERGWGRIVSIGSSGVQQPIPNLALSNVGRAALAGFLKTLAGEVAEAGITVNMVLPGRIATDRVASLDKNNAERSGKSVADVEAAAKATIPVGRYGKPEEFGAVVAFLASEQASFVTGSQVRVDGGMVKSH